MTVVTTNQVAAHSVPLPRPRIPALILYAIPVGGENADAYVGAPHLKRATGREHFETMQSGMAVVEHPERGEVVWGDERGVTCRRWNWRQGTRTRIETTTTSMWFVLEALGPMPDEALTQAATELVRGLLRISPDAQHTAHLLARDRVTLFPALV